MVHISIYFLFLSKLPFIVGPLHEKVSSENQLNGFKVEKLGQHSKNRDNFDVVSQTTKPESRSDHDNVYRSGQTLEECFRATGRWLSHNLYKKKDSMKKKTCYCKGSSRKVEYWVSRSENFGGEGDTCSLNVKREGSDGRATVESAESAPELLRNLSSDFKISSQKSPNSPTETTGTPLYSGHSLVSSVAHPNHGQRKKTYRSKTSNHSLPRNSLQGPECSCKECIGKGCMLCCDIAIKPTAFCIICPYLTLCCICTHSCDPCDYYCNKIYPPSGFNVNDMLQ